MRLLALLSIVSLLVGCASNSQKAMSPLPPLSNADQVTPEVIWKADVGAAPKDAAYGQFTPYRSGNVIYSASASGTVTAVNSGRTVWSVALASPLSAAVGGNERVLVVADVEGNIIALSTDDGHQLWTNAINRQVLAPPIVNDDLVVVRTANHQVFAFSIDDGQRKWVYQRTNPPLILRSAATPIFAEDFVILGLPAGRLGAIKTANGALAWEGQVSQPKGATELERVVDISAPPSKDNRIVCASAYQGQTSCFDMGEGGKKLWTKDIPSALGTSIYASLVFITDQRGAIFALSRQSGSLVWRQEGLQTRASTVPVPFGSAVVVGDLQGYVHFLKTSSGALMGRIATDGSPIMAPPQVIGDKLLVQTAKGGLYLIGLTS